MRKKRSPHSDDTQRTVTPERATRLHRLVKLLNGGPQTRSAIGKRLRLDTRGFYRDLEFVRATGVGIGLQGQHYFLEENLKEALGKLPFPDPGLTLSEATQLAKGRSSAHRKIKALIQQISR